MKNLSKEQFLPIVRIILETGLVGKLQEEHTIMGFLSSIRELRTMKSLDGRYNNLYDDVHKHWVDNYDDYDDENLFFTRLKLLEDSKLYFPFLESCVNPAYITNEEYRQHLVKVINAQIEQYGIQLGITTYEGGIGHYRVMDLILEMDTTDILRNKIPFYVEKHPSGYSHRKSSHAAPPQYPAFLLVSDDGWSDGYAHVQFNLFLYLSEKKMYSFGLVKLVRKNSDKECSKEHHYFVKDDGLPDVFQNLPPEFCTLGQKAEYYSGIKKACPNTYMSVFVALRDVAIFSQIDDEFRNTQYYSCLVRDNAAERNIREARLLLEGVDVENRYSFEYTFRPKYSENDVSFQFSFRHPRHLLSRRIYAVIGKNGVGKTLFISTLPRDLSSASEENFHPRKPLLSKVISFSESNFDNFKQADNNSRLNYVHCGMVKQVEDDVNIPKSKKDLTSELLRAYEKVAQLGRVKHLRRVLKNLVNEELISKLFENKGGDEYVLCKATFHDLMKKMSSGESIMFYLFCMLEAEMRYDSLILLDEPETHLHPNAMSELICALDDMLQDYESCCIMVTHSPLLVRELSSDCVYVMEREGKISVVRKPGIETIGADLTMLTDDIFGSREVQRNYKRRIAEMASRMSYAQMVERIKSKDLPLGLGIELFIRSLYPNGNEEEKLV